MSEHQLDQDAMMRAWAEAGALGEKHRYLERFEGTWDCAFKFWFQGPGAPPAESGGTAVNRWLFPGRWQAMEMTGEMGGQPYSGFGITGYDNLKRKFVGCWVDNMGTSMAAMEGNLTPDGKTLVVFGVMNDAPSGEHDRMQKYVTRWLDDDRHVFEIWDLTAGESGARMLEIRYTRRR